MKANELLNKLENMGIDTIAGVPDSTLKQFCDGLNVYKGGLRHYVTVNEGAAVGLAIGAYLSSEKPACVYMQNSGEGNIINPLASLANDDVYGIPMLFIIGWRGEPGVHDEPQHVFQGKVTTRLLEVMNVAYSVIDNKTTADELDEILKKAKKQMDSELQYALVVKKGTFEAADRFEWENGNSLVREEALGTILRMLPENASVISTTGKISRELYEQSDILFGKHDNIFMTVGGMGHASMIAFGVALNKPEKRIICIDGDGAALMHMGSMAFVGNNAPSNFVHIIINNMAHESVGGMPTDCQQLDFTALALDMGYKKAVRIRTMDELAEIGDDIGGAEGPILYEVMVSLGARADLGRPKESAKENKEVFMRNIK